MSVGGQKMRRLLSAVDGTVRRDRLRQRSRATASSSRTTRAGSTSTSTSTTTRPAPTTAPPPSSRPSPPASSEGQRVSRCQHVAYIGDSGNAEGAGPHLHFEIRQPRRQRPAVGVVVGDGRSTRTTACAPRCGEHDADGRAERAGGAPFAIRRCELVEPPVPATSTAGPPTRGGAQYWTGRLNSKRRHAGVVHRPAADGARVREPHRPGRPALLGLLRPHPRHRRAAALDRRVRDDGTTLGDDLAGLRRQPRVRADLRRRSTTATSSTSCTSNVLGRRPDAGGRDVLGRPPRRRAPRPRRRHDRVLRVARVPRAPRPSKVRVVLAYVAMLERSPDQGGLDHWSPTAPTSSSPASTPATSTASPHRRAPVRRHRRAALQRGGQGLALAALAGRRSPAGARGAG